MRWVASTFGAWRVLLGGNEAGELLFKMEAMSRRPERLTGGSSGTFWGQSTQVLQRHILYSSAGALTSGVDSLHTTAVLGPVAADNARVAGSFRAGIMEPR